MVNGGCHDVQAHWAKEELYILQAEWGGVGGSSGVFARAEEKIKGNANHLSNGYVSGNGGEIGHGDDVEEDLYRDWFDACWRWVFALVGCEEAFQAEVGFAIGIMARIRGPQTLMRLCNAA